MADEDIINETLDDIGVANYDNVEKILNQPEMTPQKNKAFIETIIKNAKFKKSQLKGFKANVTKQFKSGKMSQSEAQTNYKRVDNANVVLKQYIQHYDSKVKMMKGSGIRKQKGGNVMFFNDPKELVKKLEIIIGEILAGNTSIKMRNMCCHFRYTVENINN